MADTFIKTLHDKTGIMKSSNSLSHYALTTNLPCSGSHTYTKSAFYV